MSRQIRAYDVFVSSPGDVQDERKAVERIVGEINAEFVGQDKMFYPFLWETSTLSDLGTDAQEVINKQVGDQYDVYLGIIWSRFGTPTERAGSGTEEEFNRALERQRSGDNPPRFMFFVRQGPYPSELDTEQLNKVRQFRKRLGTEGLLFRPYSTVEQFEIDVARHLRKYLLDPPAPPALVTGEGGDPSLLLDAMPGLILHVVNQFGQLGKALLEPVRSGDRAKERAVLGQIESCVAAFETKAKDINGSLARAQVTLAGRLVLAGPTDQPVLIGQVGKLQAEAQRTLEDIGLLRTTFDQAPVLVLGDVFLGLTRRLVAAVDVLSQEVHSFQESLGSLTERIRQRPEKGTRPAKRRKQPESPPEPEPLLP